ncbi:hypothetical protein [Aliikangiella maris]
MNVDILVSEKLDSEKLKKLCCGLIGDNKVNVEIVGDESELVDNAINLVLKEVKGEYQVYISLYDCLGILSDISEIMLAKKICSLFKVRCLVSDDSNNPFTMWLVDENSDLFIAFLDEDKLEYDEYFVKMQSQIKKTL